MQQDPFISVSLMKKSYFLSKKLILAVILPLIGAVAVLSLIFFGNTDIRHVVLISIDTCRADHLSCYGFKQQTTPVIDALAKDAVLFEHCISPVPLTLPSHSSMLTGDTPLTHGVHDNVDYHLDATNTTLAEVLKENDYSTGAVVSTFVLDKQFGMDQGFDDYNDTFENPMSSFYETERRGDEATQVAIGWLEAHKDEKSFLFLHYYDPHQSYRPPEPFASRFADNLYAGEIAYTDHCIGQVIETLKDLGIYKNTLLIVTSDHGEGRGDHGEEQHGYYVYQSCVHVPLIIKSPGKAKDIRIGDTVGLIDIVPTICGQLGIAAPEVCTGIDLGVYLEKKPVQNERYLYSESLLPTRFGCSPLMSLVQGRWKYIQSPRAEMYDLAKDPGETTNLFGTEEKRARLFKDTLKLMVQEQIQTETTGINELDAESREKLESLGYVAGQTVQEDFSFDETKDDPKDWLFINQKIMLVSSLLKAEQYQEAEKICLEILAEKPNYILGYYYIAGVQHKLRKYDEAIAHAEEFLQRVSQKEAERSQDDTPLPDNPRYQADSYNILGMCYAETQQYPKALKAYQAAIENADQALSSQVHYNIGNIYLAERNYDKARDQYTKAIELNPHLAEAHLNTAIACLNQNDFDRAREHLEKALWLRPGWDLAARNLAAVARKETLLKTIAGYQSALKTNPNQRTVLGQLASSYYLLGDKHEAAATWTKQLALEPDSAETLNNLAFVLSEDATSDLFDPDQALGYALRACELTGYRNVDFLDTLAGVYAVKKDFSNAADICRQALELALSNNQTDIAALLRNKISAYEENRLP